ncbi:helix-turn-helix domain-containing protein [Saccharopolyspora sp. ASAGF58]|uniref:helix-turn-helix domain-containing protein n=1 Tax=Saccharopolyspora sp. ASAGF58 TaxID=2719023 RepID=UPI001FF0D896|nr:helix-turn-helix domain-containing protein [Saccharopolyspora sp. ASAGF58]
MQKIPRGARIAGLTRENLALALKTRYEQGASIRQLREQSGRSFGAVRRLLCEAGAQLRPCGVQRKPERPAPPVLSRTAL